MEVNSNCEFKNRHKQKLKTNSKVNKFDKNAYRKKKYCVQNKLVEWDLHRRNKLLRELKQDATVSYQNKSYFQDKSPVINDKNQIKLKKSMRAAAKREEKINAHSERCKRRQEKDEALEKYKEKRNEMYKKLSRKTRKGQPVMKERLELLLQKIQLTR